MNKLQPVVVVLHDMREVGSIGMRHEYLRQGTLL